MAHFEHDPSQVLWQAVGSNRPRRRRCLLKGCEQPFQPPHPLSRYCSPDCSAAARRHTRWLAGQKYRVSEHGQEKRKLQCRRRRQRLREQASAPDDQPREGHHYQKFPNFFPAIGPAVTNAFRSRAQA